MKFLRSRTRYRPRPRLPYRPCVGAMLLNASLQVLIAKRIGAVSNAWQMPQGGIDSGETPEQAVMRELQEEIGSNNAEIIAVSQMEYTYDIPRAVQGKFWQGRYRGQRQRWFLMRYLGEDADIDLNTHEPEFSEWRWASLQELPQVVAPFKKKTYIEVVREFSPIIQQLQAGTF